MTMFNRDIDVRDMERGSVTGEVDRIPTVGLFKQISERVGPMERE